MESSNPPARIIRLPDVIQMVGLGRTAIYDRVKDKTFPQPVKLGRVNGWIEAEVQTWIEERMREREG